MLHTETVRPSTLGLISEINSLSTLADFSLVGGTSLALRFGYRLSIDLDYFSPKDFNPDTLLSIILGFNKVRFVSKNDIGLFVFINKIKVDFVKHPFPLISPIETIDGVRMFSLEDISAMKIASISGRAEKKDFYDLYYLCHHFKPLDELIRLFLKKYKVTSLMHIFRSLQYFIEAEDSVAPKTLDKSLRWPIIKSFFTKEVNALVLSDRF
ncbi:MAG: nucleotidyl transferase AbiEii/AbiGii toxin family protein [Bacteroidota bacterium]